MPLLASGPHGGRYISWDDCDAELPVKDGTEPLVVFLDADGTTFVDSPTPEHARAIGAIIDDLRADEPDRIATRDIPVVIYYSAEVTGQVSGDALHESHKIKGVRTSLALFENFEGRDP